MQRSTALLKANIIVFISSFCVMVIELIAARMMAPSIGVSLYTWTSIIGVILAGIALGNFTGGKIADKYPSPLVLAWKFPPSKPYLCFSYPAWNILLISLSALKPW